MSAEHAYKNPQKVVSTDLQAERKVATKCTYSRRLPGKVIVNLYSDGWTQYQMDHERTAGAYGTLLFVLGLAVSKGWALACVPREVG